MCLSTVYAKEMSDSTALMSNVMQIECGDDNTILLRDIMGRTMTVEGTLKKADLTEGYVILNIA